MNPIPQDHELLRFRSVATSAQNGCIPSAVARLAFLADGPTAHLQEEAAGGGGGGRYGGPHHCLEL